MRANSDCDRPSFCRIARMSIGRMSKVRLAFIRPRGICPACLTLETSFAKSFVLIGTPPHSELYATGVQPTTSSRITSGPAGRSQRSSNRPGPVSR